jgi:hypothetical protein
LSANAWVRSAGEMTERSATHGAELQACCSFEYMSCTE